MKLINNVGNALCAKSINDGFFCNTNQMKMNGPNLYTWSYPFDD